MIEKNPVSLHFNIGNSQDGLSLTLKVPGRQIEPGEGRDEEQGERGRQELSASATHSQHPLGGNR